MFVPFLYPEKPAPDAWLRRTYVFFISLFVRFLFSFLPFSFFRFFISCFLFLPFPFSRFSFLPFPFFFFFVSCFPCFLRIFTPCPLCIKTPLPL